MSKKENIITSDSGKTYRTEGDSNSGYRIIDCETKVQSIYSCESLGEIKSVINNVENGLKNDLKGFGKTENQTIDDDYDENDDFDDDEPLDKSEGYNDQDHLEEMINYWDSL